MNKDIEQALASLRDNAARYDKPQRYYNGEHDLAFATEKFVNTFGTLFREFALNLCPVICDAVRDKLRVTGFSTEAVGSPANSHNSANSANSATRGIWRRNRMATRSGEIHKEALKCGDAYIFAGQTNAAKRHCTHTGRRLLPSQPTSTILTRSHGRRRHGQIRINAYVSTYSIRTASNATFPARKARHCLLRQI